MRPRYAAALIVALLVGAAAAGSYVLLVQHQSSSSTSTTQGSCTDLTSVQRTQLNGSQFGSVTTFRLPQPLRSPNSIASAPDGSIWFGEAAVPGLAHLFLNGTLVEFPWPFPNSTPSSICFDRSEIWGVVIWNGLVWASDPANNQLVGMNQTTGKLTTIPLGPGVLPRFLAVDSQDNLWFTETSLPSQVGVVRDGTAVPLYRQVPADAGEYTASLLFENSSSAYVVTVNPDDNHGQVFSFDPGSASPGFLQVGGNHTLLGPYSVAVSQGGIWVGEHQASYLAFFDPVSGAWTSYPTPTDPKLPLTLPYYLLANGSSVWFNVHDANAMAVLSDRTTLTEYAMSEVPIDTAGIGNALTIALDRNLAWFAAWTTNTIGYANASITPTFSLAVPENSSVTQIPVGGSARFQLEISGSSSRPINVTFSDSESINSFPEHLSFVPDVASIPSLDGPQSVTATVSASPSTPPGDYLLLMTITDGLTSRSVYVQVEVT